LTRLVGQRSEGLDAVDVACSSDCDAAGVDLAGPSAAKLLRHDDQGERRDAGYSEE
jgi:hypothetical protein